MEATAVARPVRGMHLDYTILKKTPFSQLSLATRKPFSKVGSKRIFFSAKASATPTEEKSNSQLSMQVDKKTSWSSFPDGFEKFVLQVCEETEIAEVMVKVGKFEMHLKRNVGAPKLPAPVVSPTTAPPIPTEPMNESALASPASTPKKSTLETSNSFANISPKQMHKFASLNASGVAYVVVPSPTVGSFRSGKTIKGKKFPPSCKEGDMIQEGQVIGYVDQFGKEHPIKSDVDGEILKVLVLDGESVGFADPVLAVLPSFHSINKS